MKVYCVDESSMRFAPCSKKIKTKKFSLKTHPNIEHSKSLDAIDFKRTIHTNRRNRLRMVTKTDTHCKSSMVIEGL